MQTPPSPQGVNLTQEFLSLQRRMKMVEESVSNLRRQEQLNEQNTIAINKRVGDQIAEFREDIRGMEQSLEKLKTEVRMIITELQACAKSEDVTMLRKYVNMLNPIHFVTQSEVGKIVEEKMREYNGN